MAVVAVTGDIGAGKSTAAKLIAGRLKCLLIDADKITAELWHDEGVKKIFVSRWGSEADCQKGILSPQGEIIKSEISRRIFSDPDEYKFCNSVLHPLIMKELKESGVRGEGLGVENKNLILEIPLLFEACEARPEWIDKIIYVEADFEVRAKRCFKQRNWSVEELKRRESFLLPRDKKISMSDFIIQNDGSPEELNEALQPFLKGISVT